MKAQSELAGDGKSAAEMTAPHAPREVTAWKELTKSIESVLTGFPKINIEPIYSGLTSITDSMASVCDSLEVNIASLSGNVVKTTSQIRRKSSALDVSREF